MAGSRPEGVELGHGMRASRRAACQQRSDSGQPGVAGGNVALEVPQEQRKRVGVRDVAEHVLGV
jgi:hypothetical protein